MKKTAKVLALILVFCLAASAVYSATTKIKTKIFLTPDSAIFFENLVSIDTPTLKQKIKLHAVAKYNDIIVPDLSIKSAEGFKVLGKPEVKEEEGRPVGRIFSLEAPDKAGKNIIVFEGITDEGIIFHFDTTVEVVEDDPSQTWLRVGSVVGILLVAVGVILLISNL